VLLAVRPIEGVREAGLASDGVERAREIGGQALGVARAQGEHERVLLPVARD
jgi:hypothetical protein